MDQDDLIIDDYDEFLKFLEQTRNCPSTGEPLIDDHYFDDELVTNKRGNRIMEYSRHHIVNALDPMDSDYYSHMSLMPANPFDPNTRNPLSENWEGASEQPEDNHSLVFDMDCPLCPYLRGVGKAMRNLTPIETKVDYKSLTGHYAFESSLAIISVHYDINDITLEVQGYVEIIPHQNAEFKEHEDCGYCGYGIDCYPLSGEESKLVQQLKLQAKLPDEVILAHIKQMVDKNCACLNVDSYNGLDPICPQCIAELSDLIVHGFKYDLIPMLVSMTRKKYRPHMF